MKKRLLFVAALGVITLIGCNQTGSPKDEASEKAEMVIDAATEDAFAVR